MTAVCQWCTRTVFRGCTRTVVLARHTTPTMGNKTLSHGAPWHGGTVVTFKFFVSSHSTRPSTASSPAPRACSVQSLPSAASGCRDRGHRAVKMAMAPMAPTVSADLLLSSVSEFRGENHGKWRKWRKLGLWNFWGDLDTFNFFWGEIIEAGEERG